MSFISSLTVLLIKEIRIPGEISTDIQKVTDKRQYIQWYRVHLVPSGNQTLGVIIRAFGTITEKKPGEDIFVC